ncbi:MAG TPA: hypothetical protein VF752_00095 [Thermoleophilaceae bacterium]
MTRAVLLAAGLVATVVASGCQSTQNKNDELAKQAKKLTLQKGLKVTRTNKHVDVVHTTVLQDANGAAAVVTLRNLTSKPLPRQPISIAVLGGGGKKLFANDAPGLEPSLVNTPPIPARGTAAWIDDQLQLDGRPKKVNAKVGVASAAAKVPAREPKLIVSRPTFHDDPISGIAVVGTVKNASKVEQRKLVISVIARKGGRIVAAGRGQIERLKPGKTGNYKVFFIGNPRGARLSVSAPPTQFK